MPFMLRFIIPPCRRKVFPWLWLYGQTLKSFFASFCVIRDDGKSRSLALHEDFEKVYQEGQLHSGLVAMNSMDKQGLVVPIDNYCFALKECINQENLPAAAELHYLLVENGYELISFIGCYLIRMFAVCGTLYKADQMFNKLHEPSLFAWSAIISAHAKHGHGENAVKLYYNMLHLNIQPDRHIFVATLQACANAAVLTHGKTIYVHAVESGFESHIFVLNAVINMYLKCHSFDDACSVFNASQVQDVVTWNVMMEGYVQHGCCQRASQFFNRMQNEGINPDKITYMGILKACSSMEAPEQGKMIHLYIFEIGLEADVFVGSALIDMYCKCGSLDAACEAFTRREVRDVVVWRAMITGYASHGFVKESFELFFQMQQEGLEIGKITYASVLKACSNAAALHHGKLIHTYIIETGLKADMEIGNTLMDLYTKCGSLENARKIFDGLRGQDVVTWTAIIGGYAGQGHNLEAFQLFHRMYQEGIKPDKVMFVIMLKACTQGSALEQGRRIHSYIEEDGFESDFWTGSTLIDMYARYGMHEDARWILNRLFTESFITQGLMLAGNGNGWLPLELSEKTQEGMIVSLLQSCSTLADLEGGQLVHAHFIESGFRWAGQVVGSLIDMYAICGSLNDACNVFETLQKHDVLMWCAMIGGYAQHGQGDKALQIFHRMQQQGIEPNQITFVSILKACSNAAFLKHGRMMHASIKAFYLGGDRVLNNTLIDMYAKCGSLKDAQVVFDKLLGRDTVTWNALIAGYANDGYIQGAFELFQEMQKEGTEPDTATIIGILKACSTRAVLQFGKLMHNFICESGYESNVFLGNSLMDMYTKCGSLDDAESVFERSQCRNQVMWGLIISGHAHCGYFEKALHFFQQMHQEGVTPDSVTIMSALKACSSTGALVKGMLLHALIILSGFESNMYVSNTLIDLYSKCGSLEDAQKVFTCLSLRNVATWNTMIAGCAHNDECEMAWQYFKDMHNDDVKPDAVTFMCVLSACSHLGLVGDGLQQFQCMVEQHGITPTAELYNCIIDLLGRAGYLLKAEDLLCSLPFVPNHVGWMSLLGHCKLHGSTEVGNRCFDHIIMDESRNAAGYVLMADMYSHAGWSEEADRMKGLRADVNAWKRPGMAYLEVNSNTCYFRVERIDHAQNDTVNEKLIQLRVQMKKKGYFPGF